MNGCGAIGGRAFEFIAEKQRPMDVSTIAENSSELREMWDEAEETRFAVLGSYTARLMQPRYCNGIQ